MDNRKDITDVPAGPDQPLLASLEARIAGLEAECHVLRLNDRRFRLLMENTVEVIMVLDAAGTITECSPSWERVVDYSLGDILGENVRAFLHPDDVPRVFHSIGMFLRTPGAMIHREFRVVRNDGIARHFEGTLLNLLNESSVRGIVLNAHEITERMRMEEHFRSTLKEKETLLKEVHHRVKNNLQLISSMLGLQSHHLQDEQISKIFRESKDRVKSMALIHEKLYQSKNLTDINFSDYISTLVRYLFSSHGVRPDVVRFTSSFDGITVNIDTMIHVGLLINELVSNSLKYAFPDNRHGEINITAAQSEDGQRLRLRVSDSGIGFPDGVDFTTTPTLGLQLVNMLTTQLNGTITLDRAGGTTFIVTFPTMKH